MLNKIISADDLYWNEHEQKYVSLSEDEIKNIINNCSHLKEEEIQKIVDWAGYMRVGNILFNSFLNGNLIIDSVDSENEPVFGEKDL